MTGQKPRALEGLAVDRLAHVRARGVRQVRARRGGTTASFGALFND
jgi:hypothetical protein